jgi:hypothetical protein
MLTRIKPRGAGFEQEVGQTKGIMPVIVEDSADKSAAAKATKPKSKVKVSNKSNDGSPTKAGSSKLLDGEHDGESGAESEPKHAGSKRRKMEMVIIIFEKKK